MSCRRGTSAIALLIGLGATWTPSWAEAATITAASCDPGDVQAAVDAAVAGDTVVLPAGTCSWTTSVSWTAPADVALLGAGDLTTLGGGDATVIVDDVPSGSPLLEIETSAEGTFRLAGITVRGGSGSIKEGGMIRIGGSSAQVRLDHTHFDKTTYATENTGKLMVLGGTIAGVVDHNLFDPGPALGWIHIVNGGATGDEVWAAPTDFGGGNFIFLEDNQLSGVVNPGLSPPTYLATLTDCHTGGRWVGRYNTIIAAGVGQTHPTGHAGHDRGCRAHEIYGNTVTSPYDPATEQPNFAFEYNNSGPALAWGNSVDGVYKNIFYFNAIRKDDGTYSQTATPDGWGYCGTEFNGAGSAWDGNTDGASGYPCLDQPGRGRGDLLAGDFPNQVNTATGTIAWPNQALEPIYEWLNVGTFVSGWGGAYASNQAPTRVAENRDYYLHTPSFDGTVGVGSGPRANRPATCTAGVAYWSVDEGGNWNTANATPNDGTLDLCTGTNVWTDSAYTPHTYPHPLVGGAPPEPNPSGTGAGGSGSGSGSGVGAGAGAGGAPCGADACGDAGRGDGDGGCSCATPGSTRTGAGVGLLSGILLLAGRRAWRRRCSARGPGGPSSTGVGESSGPSGGKLPSRG